MREILVRLYLILKSLEPSKFIHFYVKFQPNKIKVCPALLRLHVSINGPKIMKVQKNNVKNLILNSKL